MDVTTGISSRTVVTFEVLLPKYTFQSCPGERWRYKWDDQDRVVINSGHQSYIELAESKSQHVIELVAFAAIERKYSCG